MKINFDGDLIFSASSDKKVNVWDSMTGELLGNFNCKGATKTMDLTKDTEYIVVASLNGILEVFRMENKGTVGSMVRNCKCKYLELSNDNT